MVSIPCHAFQVSISFAGMFLSDRLSGLLGSFYFLMFFFNDNISCLLIFIMWSVCNVKPKIKTKVKDLVYAFFLHKVGLMFAYVPIEIFSNRYMSILS